MTRRPQPAHPAAPRLVPALLAALTLAACGGGQKPARPVAPLPEPMHRPAQPEEPPPPKQAPPPSGPVRDVKMPPVHRATLPGGLEVNTVRWDVLPIAYVHLVVRSGSETDPADLPGLADLVAKMLTEGTRKRDAAKLAEAIEFYGADLWAGADEENLWVTVRTPSEHLEQVVALLAEVVTRPAFDKKELDKLRKRELDRLELQRNNPRFLARRELYGRLYGQHPYARIDTTREALRKVRRSDLVRWHRRHVVPGNAFVVAVGDVPPGLGDLGKYFSRWRGKAPRQAERPAPPERTGREVVVVDRPESAQSVVAIANLAVPRAHPDWIPLTVANQVLGGSASARLFMDLRERRSLTYGAYSYVAERVDVAPFVASASVRTEVTAQAVEAFFEHLERFVREAPSEEELQAAERYLSDSFPLRIETPRHLASLLADLRIFGLPDDYWDHYRSAILKVTAEEALRAARAHVHPDRALVVVVGRAADVAPPLRRWGPVTIVDLDGKVVEQLSFQPADGEAAEPTEPAAAAQPADGGQSSASSAATAPAGASDDASADAASSQEGRSPGGGSRR